MSDPNFVSVQVGTGRFRRSHKYHDKNVDSVWVSDNGYMVTVSTGSKFVKIWKVTHLMMLVVMKPIDIIFR